MANFIYRPYREIIIHEIRELEIQPFMEGYVSQLLSQGQAGITPVATWVDGIAFYIGNFMETPEMVKEKLEGRIHWAAVYYTKTSFQLEKKVSVGGRDYIIKFVKGEANPDFVGLIKFLNQRPDSQA
ncbi:MAG: hypothetical protein ABSG45_09980 [Nitrososphaerales archaeon]|jgi:hypothetical protein